jgi:hypothetical protein
MREQDFENEVVADAIALRDRGVQRCLTGIGKRMVDVGAVFDEEADQLPVAVEAGIAELEIVSEDCKGRTVREKKANGTDVAVVGAPLDQGYAIAVGIGGGVSCGEIVEDSIGAAFDDLLE